MNTLINKTLAQEYEYLLEKTILSDEEADTMSLILQLAEYDSSLNLLISQLEKSWLNKSYDEDKEDYAEQVKDLEERLNLIDNLIDQEIDKNC